MKLSLEEFIDYLFSTPPKEPVSYNIILPTNINKSLILFYIMMCGLHKLYGKIKIQNISKEQFEHLNKYIKSISYNIKYEIDNNRELKVQFEHLRRISIK